MDVLFHQIRKLSNQNDDRTHARANLIVADSSKWGVVANYQIATINGIDKLITTKEFDPEAIEDLTSASVECLIASERTIRTDLAGEGSRFLSIIY